MKKESTKTLTFTDTDNSGGIIHVANIKGGVGKSTVATNLAGALSKMGSTLVIDLDVQGSATHALGHDPAEFDLSSWNLFSNRFSSGSDKYWEGEGFTHRVNNVIRKAESHLLPQIVGNESVTSLITQINPSLDLIPANSDLFKSVYFYHYHNFLHNLQLCRRYYKYIIVDTPSYWNKTMKLLYVHSDLNLIPVTLNALSTKSLRDYLKNIKKLSQKHPRLRVRIVKNEVFGKGDRKIKDKVKTIRENRLFLEGLCEQVVMNTGTGVSMLPQSIIFDLEIPESVAIHNAQDAGLPVQDFGNDNNVVVAFEKLARQVQYVLNNPIVEIRKGKLSTFSGRFSLAVRAIAVILLFAVLMAGSTVNNFEIPRPLAPEEIVEKPDDVIIHRFDDGQSLYRIAKYAICRLAAVVPGKKEINDYLKETIEKHNNTRAVGEKKINPNLYIPKGTVIKFFPPKNLMNSESEKLRPVYDFFCQVTADPFGYVTGDWNERGTGGGTPHYGIDVGGKLGTKLITPVDGTAYLKTSNGYGRMVAIVTNHSTKKVLFYAHMDKRFVTNGQKVKKGQVVGTIGMTGRTSGPHVHIGCGIEFFTGVGMTFGGHKFKLTDPKFLYYELIHTQNTKAK